MIDEQGRVAHDRARRCAARLPAPAAPERIRVARAGRSRCAELKPADSDETLRGLLRSSAIRTEIDRFWDVFIRPALNLPRARRAPTTGSSPSRPRCSAERGVGISCSRRSRSARCTGTPPAGRWAAGATVRPDRASRASTNSTPTPSSSPLRRPRARPPARRASRRRSRTRRSSASTCSSTGRSLRTRLRRCSTAPRTGCSTAGALTGHEPPGGGQYLTVVSSGAPSCSRSAAAASST